MENNFIDKLAQKALEDMEVPYRSADWDEMNARLDEERSKKGRLFLFKGIELGLVALVIWALFQFANFGGDTSEATLPVLEPKVSPTQQNPTQELGTPTNLKSQEPSNVKSPQNSSVPASKPIPDAKSNDSKAKGTPIANTKTNKSSINNIANNNSNNKITNNPVTQELSGADSPRAERSQQPTAKRPNSQQQSAPTTRKYPAPQLPTDKNNKLVDRINQAGNNPMADRSTQAVQSPTVNGPSANHNRNALAERSRSQLLPTKDAYLLPRAIDLQLEPVAFSPGDPLPKLKHRGPWHLRIFASPDMNMMDGHNGLGASVGALFSKEITRQLQVESGLVYNHKQFTYAPGDIEPVKDNPVQLADVLISQVEVPVNMQFTIKKSTNWRPYAIAGLSANFIAYSDYNYTIDKNAINGGADWEFDYPQKGKGLIHGGDFGANNYYTANLGIGLERQLEDNIHLFVQPTFKYALNGMGLNDDKLNTFSLTMGVRAKLK